MTNEERDKRINKINELIAYWSDYKKNEIINGKSINYIDADKNIEDLAIEKYDLLHGTHMGTIKRLQHKVELLESLLMDSHFLKRRRYIKELKKTRDEIFKLYRLDQGKYYVIIDYDKENEESHRL